MRGKEKLPRGENVEKKRDFVPPRWLVTIVWLIGFFAVWELIAFLVTDIGGDTMNRFPHLYMIVYWCFSTATVTTSTQSYTLCGATVWGYLWDTFSIAVLGFLIGFVLGVLFAFLMSLFLPVQKVGYPFLLVTQMIPMLGLAPIFLSIFPELFVSKMFMAAYMSFFPIAANTFAGFRSVDKERRELMKISAANTAQVYTKLMFPAALPSMFVGLKLAAPAAFCAVIFTELLKTDGGLGYGIFSSQYASRWDLCWGYIFMAILVGVLIFYSVGLVQHFVIRWKSSD